MRFDPVMRGSTLLRSRSTGVDNENTINSHPTTELEATKYSGMIPSPDDKKNTAAISSSDNIPVLDNKTPKSPSLTPSISFFIVKAAAIASLGGVLFGYDMGVVSGALPQISTEFDLSRTQKEAVVSFLYIGAGIGAAVGGTLCDFTGRRTGILVTDIIFILGALVLALARNLQFILLGRVVVGFGVSVSGIADVAYLHEISPERIRGALVSCNEACISLGFLLAYISGYFLSLKYPEEGWRVMFGLSAIIAVLQFVGMLSMPESPVWLASQGRSDEARLARQLIHGEECKMTNEGPTEKEGTDYHSFETENNTNISVALNKGLKHFEVEEEHLSEYRVKKEQNLYGLCVLHEENLSIGTPSTIKEEEQEEMSVFHVSWWRELIYPLGRVIITFCREIKHHYRQTVVALFLTTTQQFCGHGNVLNFAPEIFSQAGFGSESSLASTLLLGIVKFSVTVVVIWKIETVGRRVLLLGGMSLISFSLLLLSFAFHGAVIYADLALVGAVGVAMGYAGSFGPLTWLLTSEMFPTYIRGRALGASTLWSYLCASLVSYTFLSGQNVLGRAGPFVIYFVVTLLSTVFAALSIPDTGGKTPDDIEAEMKKMWMWRKGSGYIFQIQEKSNLLSKA